MTVTIAAVVSGFSALVATYVCKYSHHRYEKLRIALAMKGKRATGSTNGGSCDDCHKTEAAPQRG